MPNITNTYLANLYGHDRATIKKWLEKIPGLTRIGYIYTPDQVQLIFKHLGKPEKKRSTKARKKA